MKHTLLNSSSGPLAILLLFGLVWCVSCSDTGASQSGSSPQGDGGKAPAQSAAAGAQVVDVTQVISQKLTLTVRLPGEITPYEAVAVYPKVTAFVRWIGVDRGSKVKAGQEIIRLEAPELVSQKQEAQSKMQTAISQRAEAQARLVADESTFQRLKSASATPGVVAANDVEVARQTAEADRSRVRAAEQNVEAAKSALSAIGEIESYLRVKASFDGVVTERNVHPGALVGPTGNEPMIRIEKVSRLRLVLPVPETYVSGVVRGAKVWFTVNGLPGEKFEGTIARVADSLDVKTRTMPVELDVMNPAGRLAPGMYPEVDWPVRRAYPTAFVPVSAVARTNERIFVVRIRDDKTEWVNVQTGLSSKNLIEVFGDLHEGDLVATRGTDELKPGVTAKAQMNLEKKQ